MFTAVPVTVTVHLAPADSPSSLPPLDFCTNFTPAFISLSLGSPHSDCFSLFAFAFLCRQGECLVLRGTPGLNPVVLAGGCNSTTGLSSLNRVLVF